MSIPKTKKKSVHYVNNVQLLGAMTIYKDQIIEARTNNVEIPRVPPYVGECIMKIATHLAFRPNFSNYTFREDMISDGIENCLQYIENFDPAKSSNPFAYFTQIIYFAFIRRIQKEKKYLYTKHAATKMAELNNRTTDSQDHDHTTYRSDVQYGEWSQEQMLRFMEDFERSKRKRRNKVLDNEEEMD